MFFFVYVGHYLSGCQYLVVHNPFLSCRVSLQRKERRKKNNHNDENIFQWMFSLAEFDSWGAKCLISIETRNTVSFLIKLHNSEVKTSILSHVSFILCFQDKLFTQKTRLLVSGRCPECSECLPTFMEQ